MFDSLDKDEIVKMKNDPSCTICPGLSAPFPGKKCRLLFIFRVLPLTPVKPVVYR